MKTTLLVLVVYCLTVAYATLPIVNVKQGQIQGTYITIVNGRTINAFLGVPYAKPPVGSNRFEPPSEVEKWEGIWNASTKASDCLQYRHIDYGIVGEEDCLYINIYAPKDSHLSSKKLDVIIYIHGGAFMYGTGNIKDGDLLLSLKDVVYITINYRLGPLGFLSTGDDVVSGNNGLKDQSFALRWIKENIESFGGNSNSITITGMSAGGVSVHYHYLSPLSRGLFHKGISQSGSTLTSWALPKFVPEKSKKIAEYLGCPLTSTITWVNCLKKRPAKQILSTVKYFMGWLYNPYSPFGPVIEKEGKNSFLTDAPYKLLKSGNFYHVPWIGSLTTEEGLYPAAEFAHENTLKDLNENWSKIAPHLLDYNYTVSPDQKEEVAKQIKEFFLGDKPVDKNTYKDLVKMIGSRLFDEYVEKACKMQASTSTAPVYHYKFGYRGKNSLSNIYARDTNNYGVSHADDTQYTLKMFWSNPLESDREMTELMVDLWTSYASTGSPQVGNTIWPPVSKDQKHLTYLEINSPTEIQVKHKQDETLYEFWNQLFKEHPQSKMSHQHEL